MTSNYNRIITPRHRTAFAIMLDLSMAMDERAMSDDAMSSKMEVIEKSTNTLLQELYRLAHAKDGLRDYYDIAIFCYSGEGVTSLFAPLNDPFISITELQYRGATGRWIQLRALSPIESPDDFQMMAQCETMLCAKGNSPMYEAYYYTYKAIHKWCDAHTNHDSLPPIVINISNGLPSDCNFESLNKITSQLRETGTKHGNTLLFNTILTDSPYVKPLVFPTKAEIEAHPDIIYRAIAATTSAIPKEYMEGVDISSSERVTSGDEQRYGISYDDKIIELFSMLNIGEF